MRGAHKDLAQLRECFPLITRNGLSSSYPGVSAAAHATFVEVIAPDGDVPQWGSKPVILTKGRAALDIPVAHTASPGAWKIRVRELFTGRDTTAEWKVQ